MAGEVLADISGRIETLRKATGVLFSKVRVQVNV
jgi:hypothetical protein